MDLKAAYREFRRRRAHSRLWSEAEDWDDLCSLMARWCEGDLALCPTYDGPPDPETTEISEALAEMNRRGFLTLQSQPGLDPTDVPYTSVYYPATFEQRAAVEGLASREVLDRLYAAVRGTRLELQANPRAFGWGVDRRTSVPVTVMDGTEVFTAFGARISAPKLKFLFGDFVLAGLVHELCDSWQVLVYDPHWGEHRLLWDRLSSF